MGGDAAPAVLALLPSVGLGGGIESFADAALEALQSLGLRVQTLALTDVHHPRATRGAKARFALKAMKLAWGSRARVVCLHPGLGPIALLAGFAARGPNKPLVVFYGVDLWRAPRWQVRLLRRWSELGAISDFTAGAVCARARTSCFVIPATIDEKRIGALSAAVRLRTDADLVAPGLLSVFRLNDAAAKGADVVIEAARQARREYPDLTLTIAGRGPIPPELAAATAGKDWVTIRESPPLDDLSRIFSDASLFVLATRTRPWDPDRPSGEGFGLVLTEAQLTGLPVVAPASGGSTNAFSEGETGVRPADESAGALCRAILAVLGDSDLYQSMSRRATEWAGRAADPRRMRESLAMILSVGGD